VRILYISHRIPYPPDKGEKIRAFHQLKAIASRHEVDLFTLADNAADLAGRQVLLEHCRDVQVALLSRPIAQLRAMPFLLTRKPLTLPYFYSAELKGALRKAFQQRSYDRVYVYCSAMGQYLDGIAGQIPIVTDFVDVDSDKWRQYAAFRSWPFSAIYRREGATLRNYERQIIERSSCVIVTTEREARLAQQISDATPIHVIPNGVDTEYFKPSATRADTSVPTIGFVGDMRYFPNEQAVTHFTRVVLPLVRQRVPAARFCIVGRNPTPAVQKLGAIDGVEVSGFVPDVRPHLARMHVSVAPFAIAAGIQNKILEAMARGLPVVGTSRAVQGLSAFVAGAVDCADKAEEMATKIADLLLDPELARAKGLEGRSRVIRDYHWGQSLERLLQVLEHPGAGAAASTLSRTQIHR
jgi:sugar transferase (PEP-CTERM/EpsH1 system associated)